MSRFAVVAVVIAVTVAAASPMEELEVDVPIRAVLDAQAKAWNDGDIAGYMEHYWKSERLTFSSGGETTRGWAATKSRYDKRYSTPEQMGRLTFSEIEVQPLAQGAALVLGRWRLDRKADSPAGNFSLVFLKLDDRWVIFHDHTSLAPEE